MRIELEIPDEDVICAIKYRQHWKIDSLLRKYGVAGYKKIVKEFEKQEKTIRESGL